MRNRHSVQVKLSQPKRGAEKEKKTRTNEWTKNKQREQMNESNNSNNNCVERWKLKEEDETNVMNVFL